jgi:dienelactone hydrolase
MFVMRRLIITLIALATAASVILETCAEAATIETPSFMSEDVKLSAVLYRPPGAGPFPSVVALHGCSGLYDQSGRLSLRHVDWAERLSALGFLVLFPDSFGPRGLGSQCRTRDRGTRPASERVADTVAAKTYLQSRADVKAGAISLLGWSNGGSTVLYAVQAGRQTRDGRPDFARAVAFYPGCRPVVERGSWHARLPLLILIGEADDWTPAEPCKALAEAAKAAGDPVSIVTYPGAYHDFDHPDLPVRTHDGLAYTAGGGGTAHTGTDPKARADTLNRVPVFLAR